MDKTAIKNFAVWAREKLIADITQKAYEIGITRDGIEEVEDISFDMVKVKGRTLRRYEVNQRKSLVSRILDKGFDEVIEEVAYTWFNRFIALRFMEVNGYLPTGIRVLSSEEEGKVEPDIITQVEYLDLGLNMDVVHRLQDENDTEDLFRYLLVKQCNKLNEILPGLFQPINDYTEILLPDNLLMEGSVIRRLVSDISEEDFKDQVEIIGWLYQYYISEKKDQVFADLRKNVKIAKENIPAATQLFTPDWIVRYMVENSLGRLWLEGHPDEDLKANWRYYLEEAEQEPEVQRQLDEIRKGNKNLRPEDIKVLDPCMGSGHILVYAFDVLFDIYKSEGYAERDIPKLILENNLYGLDIDDRAGQLAYFAVMMKARSKSRRIFREELDLNICSIQETNGLPEEAIHFFFSSGDTDLRGDVEYLIEVFHDAKEYGSILEVKRIDFDAIEQRLDEIRQDDAKALDKEADYREVILDRIPPLVKQARIMSQKYDVVCTNPPYMGSRHMNPKLSKYLQKNYPTTKSDLFAVFIEKCIKYALTYSTLITQQSWMFLTSYEGLRVNILRDKTINTLVHLGSRAFEEIKGEKVKTVAFTLNAKKVKNYKPLFIRLSKYSDPSSKETEFFNVDNYYKSVKQTDFEMISGEPIAYWMNDRMLDVFINSPKFEERIDLTGSQHITANNERFLREFWEIDYEDVGYNWISYAKGGPFRKWHGNNSLVVDWSDTAKEFYQTNKTSNMLKDEYCFRRGITWTVTTSSKFSCRLLPAIGAFDKKGPSLFVLDDDKNGFYMGFLNSNVANYILELFSDEQDYQNIDIKRLPIAPFEDNIVEVVNQLVNNCINISKTDWDSFETSWDFQRHPILIHKGKSATIEEAFGNWWDFAEEQFNRLKVNEEELNRIFIEIYGLEDELTPEVEDRDVTVRKADKERDIKSFISYAVGCMLGRYSIDVDGLIYAGGEWNSKWKIEDGKWKVKGLDTWVDATFVPTEDNIIPILDDDYFEDDIMGRFIEFLKITFGEATLEENLDYIAEILGRRTSETSRQAIRRYFLKDFYKDHVRTYQKRPIYWLVDSGNQDGFKALIYMHRYDEFTMAKVRTDYLHKVQRMYEAEVKRLDMLIDSDVPEAEKTRARKQRDRIEKQMKECLEYDQVIAHIANQRIKIDLDDGVKVNHAKFQGIKVPQDGGKRPLKADLLAKIG